MSESEPLISVEYGGNLATRMVWHEDILAEFASRSDLRSRIIISEGASVQNRQTSNLGEVLVGRRIFDPTVKKDQQTSESSVDLYPYQNLATIKINHLILAERITKQGRFDVNAYVKEVDRLTQAGLRKVLASEKLGQTALSTMMDSALGLIALIPGTPGFFLTKDSLERILGGGNIPISVAEGLIGGTLLGLTTILGICYTYLNSHPPTPLDIKLGNQTAEPVYPYICNPGDLMLPFKHIGGFIRGSIYLKGKTLVNLAQGSL